MLKIFPIADVLQFRRDNAETSGKYAVLGDAALARMSEIEAELEIESAKRHEADLRIHTLMNEYDALRAPQESPRG